MDMVLYSQGITTFRGGFTLLQFLLATYIFILMVVFFFIVKKYLGPVNGNFNLHMEEQPLIDPVTQDTRHKWKTKMVQKAKDFKVLGEELRDE